MKPILAVSASEISHSLEITPFFLSISRCPEDKLHVARSNWLLRSCSFKVLVLTSIFVGESIEVGYLGGEIEGCCINLWGMQIPFLESAQSPHFDAVYPRPMTCRIVGAREVAIPPRRAAFPIGL